MPIQSIPAAPGGAQGHAADATLTARRDMPFAASLALGGGLAPTPLLAQYGQTPADPALFGAAGLDPAQEAGNLLTNAFFLELGFSFMVGLAMGFALKIAFKIALLVSGLILIALFGLQYIGIVEINWTGFETHYDTWAQWLGANLKAFFGFAARHLTSAASFIAGLALGLKF